MTCPKCGAENPTNSCMRCGYIDNSSNPYADMEFDELDTFIGNRADQIYKKFNFGALLFGAGWFFYRKRILAGLTLIFLVITSIAIFNKILMLPLYYTISFWAIIFLFTSNKIYINSANKKINKLYRHYGSDKKNYTYFLKRSGGTSLVLGIIFVLLYYSTLYFTIDYFSLIKSTYRLDNLTIKTVRWTSTNNGLKYYDTDKTCYIKVYHVKNSSDDFKDLLFTNNYINMDDYVMNEKLILKDKPIKINNMSWYEKEKGNSYSILNYGQTTSYFLVFEANDADDYNKCQNEFTKIKKTIKLR